MKQNTGGKGILKGQALAFLIVLMLGVIAGAFARPFFEETAAPLPTFSEVRQTAAGDKFTNPLLECRELPESISIGERKELQAKVERLIEKGKAEGKISAASVYFRDLNNGPWFGVNESLTFYPASLIKVPLAMYYYAKADTDPGILTQEINFTGPRGKSIVHFAPPKPLEENKIYTIEELIGTMLRFSDNDAAHILQGFAGADTDVVFSDLGLSAGTPGTEYAIDVRTYASFFRILFNATYLTRSKSEHMLQVLNESSFSRGIEAGVPSWIKVAHKFGEKVLDSNESQYQLHDCGIVYAPQLPYTLCIMTQGNDFDVLAAFIAEVSGLVYEQVSEE